MREKKEKEKREGERERREREREREKEKDSIKATVEHKIVGLLILGVVVQEINSAPVTRSTPKHRKIAVNFREMQLLDIFRLGLTILKQVLAGSEMIFSDANQENKIKEYLMILLRNCLSYDFIGTSIDESSEEVGSVQVPTSWRSLIEDLEFVGTFFECYKRFRPPSSSQALEVLVLVAAIRRSLFSEDERSKYLQRLLQGTSDILATSRGLDNLDNYHQFCRLLARLRQMYQWTEISEKPGFDNWLELVTDFSMKGFRSWQLAPNSEQYLLMFWAKMLSSTGTTRSPATKLPVISARLTQAYVSAKVDSVESTIDGGTDDPLDNEDALVSDLEQLAIMARCKYDDCGAVVVNLFEPVAAQYQELFANASVGVMNDKALEVIQKKFAWLVYVIAGLVGGRQTYMSTEEQDAIDAELSSKVLQLMNVTQSMNTPGGKNGSERLEMAFLHFFTQFRKSYIGESSSRVVKMYTKLSETFGLNDQNMMLNAIVQKLARNFQTWPNSLQIIRKSVKLFDDLSTGYSSVRSLRALDTVKYILENHSSKNFPFLDVPQNLRVRMSYYSALCRVLTADDNPERDIERFLEPWHGPLRELASLGSLEAFRQPAVRATLVGLVCDLRGFLFAIQGRRNFAPFFEWLYPDHVSVLMHALEAWADDPLAVQTLKFFEELATNRAQRLNFDVSSVNGILIFREMSKVLSEYGQRVVRRSITGDKYAEKYKGIRVCFNIISRSFGGRYVNFGVFSLYGDKAFDVALRTMYELMLSIPFDDLLSYPKLARSFFTLVDAFTDEHMTSLQEMDSNTFLYIMRALAEGIRAIDNPVTTPACSAVDHICTFVMQHMAKSNPKPHWLITYFTEYPKILPYLFTANFGAVLFEDRQNQWSLSRPLLGLMLLNREYTYEYTQNVLQHQLPERREFLAKAFNLVMNNVEMNLNSKNRDRFTQNIATFKRELATNGIVLLAPPPDPSLVM